MLHRYDMGDDVLAFSTTRHGGVSLGNYASFNINCYCGDDAEAIAQNRMVLAAELHIEESRIVLPHQVHLTEAAVIDEAFVNADANIKQTLLEGKDAIITRLPHVCIGVSTADCIPILLYSADDHVAAAVHAGWRGTVARIARKTVDKLISAYGVRPENLKAVVGPGISVRNFEVGDEVYESFEHERFCMRNISRRYPATRQQDIDAGITEKWHIDLPLCNRLQLMAAGLSDENITMSGICTYDHSDTFFSARRLGIHSGRIYTGIVMH